MSGVGRPHPSAPLSSAWSINHPETLLWRGAGRVTGQRAERETALVVTWQPELNVCFRQEPDDAEDLELFLDEERGEVRLRLPELGIDTPVTPGGAASGGRLTEVTWGDDEQVHRVRFHLTNFPDVLLPGMLGTPDGARWRGTIAVEGGPWTLRLDTRRETSEIIKRLKAQGTYAVTHIGELSRADRGPFGAGELQEALTCIHFLFSFARTAWAAPMLPVGFDQGGVPVWWQASARWCTAGIGRGFTWLDRHDGAGLEEVAHLWLELWQDPLWRQVLPRAVIYYLEANRQGRDAPSFLEVKWLRNQVVHPGLRDGLFGPKQEVVLAGWTLACWYVELLLSRRLGYTGRISNRLTVDHWVGQTVPVPWANG